MANEWLRSQVEDNLRPELAHRVVQPLAIPNVAANVFDSVAHTCHRKEVWIGPGIESVSPYIGA
jgi:hypothetical protein